jgi:hypothetical protein
VSANALIAFVLVVLVLAALGARVIIGPIAGVAGEDGPYVLAKIGSSADPMAERVGMARDEVRAGD